MDPDRSELAVRQRGAMQTRASGDVMVHVQHGSKVRGFQTVEVHGDGGQVIGQALAAVQAHARGRAQAVHQFGRQFHLAGVDIRHPAAVQPLLPRPQRGHPTMFGVPDSSLQGYSSG